MTNLSPEQLRIIRLSAQAILNEVDFNQGKGAITSYIQEKAENILSALK